MRMRFVHVRLLTSALVLALCGLSLAQTQQVLPSGATLTRYGPPASITPDGAAVIVCPGGGYNVVCVDYEGLPAAQWLNDNGVTAFMLVYHCGREHAVPLIDAQEAIRTVRSHAANYRIDPNKIGIMGFSAGGHLSATACAYCTAADPASADTLRRVSSRPDFCILIYPLISMQDSITVVGTRNNIIGWSPTQARKDSLSLELHVTAQTPPTFITRGDLDTEVDVRNSDVYQQELSAASVPSKYFIEKGGDHGFHPNPVAGWDWPDSCGKFLKSQGFLVNPTRSVRRLASGTIGDREAVSVGTVSVGLRPGDVPTGGVVDLFGRAFHLSIDRTARAPAVFIRQIPQLPQGNRP
jgi:acetyl esterase/lipase